MAARNKESELVLIHVHGTTGVRYAIPVHSIDFIRPTTNLQATIIELRSGRSIPVEGTFEEITAKYEYAVNPVAFLMGEEIERALMPDQSQDQLAFNFEVFEEDVVDGDGADSRDVGGSVEADDE